VPNRREYWANTNADPGSGDGPTLDLLGGRFTVSIVWRDFDGNLGAGSPQQISRESGYFTFFDEANAEVFIKVLDTCDAAGSFWVFDTHLSNVEYTILVTDTQTGQTRTIFNPLGTRPPRSWERTRSSPSVATAAAAVCPGQSPSTRALCRQTPPRPSRSTRIPKSWASAHRT